MGAARRKKLADGKKRKGAVRRQRRKRETNVKGREEKTSLPIVASRISRRGLLGEWETLRNEDEEESFLLTCGFLPLCSGALRYPARTMPFLPHFFRIYLPIGCIYQSLAANVRRRGFGAAIIAAFDVSPWRKRCFKFRFGDVADYLVMDNLVLGRKYFYVNFSDNDIHFTDKRNRIARRVSVFSVLERKESNKCVSLYMYLIRQLRIQFLLQFIVDKLENYRAVVHLLNCEICNSISFWKLLSFY